MTSPAQHWKIITDFQDKFYPGWRKEKPRLLYSTALAGEVGEVCGTITHLDGGGTNTKKYTEEMVLHQCVDTYVQLVLLLAKSGFSATDFEKEFWWVLSVELPRRALVAGPLPAGLLVEQKRVREKQRNTDTHAYMRGEKK